MKKINVLQLISTCIVLSFVVTSCGNDETPKVTAEDAKAAFNTVNQTLADDLASIADAPGYTAMNSLASLTSSSNPFGRISSNKRKDVRGQIKLSFTAFRSVLLNAAANGRVRSDEPFDYDQNKGVYAWNSDTETFTKTGESDIIKIQYPTEGSLTNDAEFQLAGYEEKSTPNGDDLYSPTFVDASIFIDGTLQAKLALDAEYGNDDEPVFANVSYFLTPYSIEVKFDDKGTTSTSFSESLSKNGETLIAVSLKVTFQSAAKDDEFIEKINGYLQLMNIRFNVSINAGDMANATDYNDIIDITIQVGSGDAGSIIVEEDPNTGEPVPYARYNDGTTESLESLFEDLVAQLEGLLS